MLSAAEIRKRIRHRQIARKVRFAAQAQAKGELATGPRPSAKSAAEPLWTNDTFREARGA